MASIQLIKALITDKNLNLIITVRTVCKKYSSYERSIESTPQRANFCKVGRTFRLVVE